MSKRIVCPLDFSEGSDAALATAAELALRLDAELDLIHVYDLPSLPSRGLPSGARATYIASILEHAQAALETSRARMAKRGVRVVTHLLEGERAQSIVSHADKVHAALLVFGTHGRTGFQHFMLGSVAERVVRTATVPVITVRLPPESAHTREDAPVEQASRRPANPLRAPTHGAVSGTSRPFGDSD
jgi:nucleotide-binding universal stress UspA family protein